MPVLTPNQLQGIVDIPVNEEVQLLYVPEGYHSPTTHNLGRLYTAACWNWALCGGLETNLNSDTTPMVLYEENAPTNPFDNQARAEYPRAYLTEPDLGRLWDRARQQNAADDDRIGFMTAMARVAARANGLTPVDDSPYGIHVTTMSQDWYNWMHWGLSIRYQGRTRFIQTVPNSPIRWGGDILEDSDEPGYVTASFRIGQLHTAHVDVIRAFLAMPRCVECRRFKPHMTSYTTRWHRCANNHVFCDRCGYRLHYWTSPVPSRARLCNRRACNSRTELVA